MKDSVNLQWAGNMAFKTTLNGHTLMLDASSELGGKDLGPRPKALLMVALAGCTGMDVVSILRKMKVDITGFNILTEGIIAEEHPKKFESIHLIYEFTGKNLPFDKIRHAIELSQQKYCGVSATLAGSVTLNYEIRLIEQ
jgi:putative redox protein